MKRILIFILLSFSFTQLAHAKARFMGFSEVVSVSDVIAIIEVNESETIGQIFQADLPQKGYWQYSQKNTFKFISIIKTAPFLSIEESKPQTVWAGKSFICAQASYEPGRYIAFLESVAPDEWITLNHNFGALRIEDNLADFGWYLEVTRKEKKVTTEQAEKQIKERILNTKSFTFEAEIPPDLLYNKWVEGSIYQKMWFHVHALPESNWPEGLFYFVRSFLKIDEAQFKEIARKGGRFSINAHWKEGSLIINSITKKE